MAKLKYEFIAQYYEKHGRPFRAWLFGNIEMINRVGCLFAPLSNWIAKAPPSRAMMDFVGIAPDRNLPPFAGRTFERWFGRRHGKSFDKKVVLFADTYLNYNYPSIGFAATEVLEVAGFEVLLADKRCCGRPMLTGGMMSEVKKNAAYNVDRLSEYARDGYEVVGFEPSCVSMLTDDYNDLIPGEETRLVAEHSHTFENFISKLNKDGNLSMKFTDKEKTILVHGHCHQKALWGIGPSLDVLNLPPGYSATAIDSACCGMAGAFGYEKEHYDISLKIGEQRLLRVVREADPSVEIAAAGLSCREQIAQTTGRTARHPAEILQDALA
jgi:Fe-S oxidoreductase